MVTRVGQYIVLLMVDFVNLDSKLNSDSESLAESESDSETNNLLDCWDNGFLKLYIIII